MSEKCHDCGVELDIEHDEHYRCDNCEEPRVLFCPSCHPRNERCPRCGGGLDFHEESITKKTFFNPATRGLLGF
jgi:hypothetical protein